MSLSKKCGQIIGSSCTLFTGPDLTFVKDGDPLALQCDASIDDVILLVDKYLKILVDDVDYTGLTPGCLTFTPATVTSKQLHQLEINAICTLRADVDALQTQVNDLNIGEEIITIDLGCLTPDAAACEVATNQYQLINILTLFVNKICDFETRISNLES